MEEITLVTSLTLFTLLAGICSIAFYKLKLPPLVGYLIAGILIANFWPIGQEGHEVVEILSKMGLVLLMFCIGLEIDLKKIRKQGLRAMGVAVVELPLLLLGGFLFGIAIGLGFVQSIVIGAIIAGSSTAVVVAVLKSSNRLTREQMETLILVIIMEDIGQVLLLSLITPMMAGSSLDPDALAVLILSIVAFMFISIAIGLKIVPKIINWVGDNVSSEVLVVFATGCAFVMALASMYFGLSMAIGAFLMGLMAASSRWSWEITHHIEPMKNLFMAMFFISVGMEVSLELLWANITMVIVFYLMFYLLKLFSVSLGYWLTSSDAETSFKTAISLVTMGEFAFIIAKEALGYGVMDLPMYTAIVGAALLSMILLPIHGRAANRMWSMADRHTPQRIRTWFDRLTESRDRLYLRVSLSSTRSKKAMYRSMTRSYINFLAIVVIELAFYFGSPPAAAWLTEAFDAPEIYWQLLLLICNGVMLSPPIYFLVTNVKYLDNLIILGARKASRRGMSDEEPGRVYQRFLDFNTYLMVIIIDSAFLILVPNALGLWEHIVVLALLCVIITYIYFKREKSSCPDEEEEGDEDECENKGTLSDGCA